MSTLDNILHTALPFYDSTEKQNHLKSQCVNDTCTFKLITGTNRLLPWQIRRDYGKVADTLDALYLCCVVTEFNDDPGCVDILSYIEAGEIEYVTAGQSVYITYFANEDLTYELPCGQFYLMAEFTSGEDTMYSEVFTVEDITDDTTDVFRSHDRIGIRITNGDERIVS